MLISLLVHSFCLQELIKYGNSNSNGNCADLIFRSDTLTIFDIPDNFEFPPTLLLIACKKKTHCRNWI